MTYNFQRKGAISNAHAGRDFEKLCGTFFESLCLDLTAGFGVPIGYSAKKIHKFDFGSKKPAVLMECRSNTWTEGGKSPSAKIRGINETMLHFHLASKRYRKMLVMLKHAHPTRSITLAAYYISTQRHLIPNGVEIWEFDLDTLKGGRLH